MQLKSTLIIIKNNYLISIETIKTYMHKRERYILMNALEMGLESIPQYYRLSCESEESQ
jgi:hypothetical protein